MTDRIYVVKDATTGAESLVRAGNQAHALRRATAPRFTAEVAGQDDLVRLLGAGVVVLEKEETPPA